MRRVFTLIISIIFVQSILIAQIDYDDDYLFGVTLKKSSITLSGAKKYTYLGNFDQLIIMMNADLVKEDTLPIIIGFTIEGFRNDDLLFTVNESGNKFTEKSINKLKELRKDDIVSIKDIEILFRGRLFKGAEFKRNFSN